MKAIFQRRFDRWRGWLAVVVLAAAASSIPAVAAAADGDNDEAADLGVLIQQAPEQPGRFALTAPPGAPAAMYVLTQAVEDNPFGASLGPAEESVRAQLGLKQGEGLVVSSVAPDGPAAKVGLQPNDILLNIGSQALHSPEDLASGLKAAGEKSVGLKLLRSGETVTIQVKPVYRMSFGPVEAEPKNFYIGVPVTAVDPTLRAQLKGIPEGKGIMATGVEPESPAAKAGLKPFDILLEFGGTALTDVESLVKQIQASKGKTTPLTLLREGKTLTLDVTPVVREGAAGGPLQARVRSLNEVIAHRYTKIAPKNGLMLAPPADPRAVAIQQRDAAERLEKRRAASLGIRGRSLEERLDSLDARLSDLTKALDELKATGKGGSKRPDDSPGK